MAKVDTALIATLIGATDDAQFESRVNAAVADLERLLGYSLSGTTEAEERIFSWHDQLWHKTAPMYDQPTSITLVGVGVLNSSNEETVTEYQLGQNGRLYGDWFNGFKLCNICQAGYCPHCAQYNCAYVKIVAKWGFAEPTPVEESGEDTTYVSVLPDDLLNVLAQAVKEAGNSKADIQSEGTGTRNYSKFAASYKTVWQKYADIIEFYRLREPRI